MFNAGIARSSIHPFPGVELTGWGYYIERRWRHTHDDINITALAVSDARSSVMIVALDLMVIDTAFTQRTRRRITEATGVPEHAILLTCSHTHNAPAAGGLLGVGECRADYEEFASDTAVRAAVEAWRSRSPVQLRCGHVDMNRDNKTRLTFNRTRTGGLTDGILTAALFERPDGSPKAVVVNFGAHPTVGTELRPWHVSRDVPGEVCDLLEVAFPGATAMYIQGACGDTNFRREFQTEQRCHEPAAVLSCCATEILGAAEVVGSRDSRVASSSLQASLPTRRWTSEEIRADREEAERRLRDKDFSNWRETIGRCMTNRPDDMVKRHGGDEAKAVRAMCRFQLEWTDLMLQDLDKRPEILQTEVQALRIGPLLIAANSSEFFTPFATELRSQSPSPWLVPACYSNGRIGYLPDEHDILAKSYAGYQSPKYCNQFPFTAESGPTMCRAMLQTLQQVWSD